MRLRVGDRVPIVGYCVIVALTNLNFCGSVLVAYIRRFHIPGISREFQKWRPFVWQCHTISMDNVDGGDFLSVSETHSKFARVGRWLRVAPPCPSYVRWNSLDNLHVSLSNFEWVSNAVKRENRGGKAILHFTQKEIRNFTQKDWW